MSDAPNLARLPLSLLLLRLGVTAVMLPWTLDKLINPAHTAAVFANFYKIPDLSATASMTVGVVQLIIVLGFVAGIARTWTYGAVLAMHTVSTLSSWSQYLNGNLLFFAAWPMLAACVVLFLLREEDRLLTVPLGLGNAKKLQS